MLKNFGKDIKTAELMRVMLTATLLVLGIRQLFFYTNARSWMQQAFSRRPSQDAISQPDITSSGRANGLTNGLTNLNGQTSTPAAIAAANQSVVMLTGNQSIGSGVILTSNGLVLTNSHVVRDGGSQWNVRFANGQERPARVVAVGSREVGIFYDLALVQVEGVSNLPVAQFSDRLPKAGELVWAIGAPYGRADVVTQGQLRQITTDGILLTNTEVHPGNSGGPLLNQNGEVVGINTEINPSLPGDADTAAISVSVLETYLPKLMQ